MADPCQVDLIYAQDIALAPYQAVRTNEYYLSQYLDLTPIATDEVGTAVAVRQNMPGSEAPWVLIGCLREGVGWATDGLQLGRPARPGDPFPGLLADRLPPATLAHAGPHPGSERIARFAGAANNRLLRYLSIPPFLGLITRGCN